MRFALLDIARGNGLKGFLAKGLGAKPTGEWATGVSCEWGCLTGVSCEWGCLTGVSCEWGCLTEQVTAAQVGVSHSSGAHAGHARPTPLT